MSEYNEGDLVEAVKGEEVVRGRLRAPESVNGRYLAIGTNALSTATYEAKGFTLTVIEKAAPKLPTEPGLYIESGKAHSYTNIWSLSANGRWLCAAASKYDGRAEEFAPFTRLEPVPVTAKKVLDEVSKFAWADGFMSQLENVAKQFGVTP